MIADLHTHSYFSDGENSPEEIIIQAKKNNVSILSITDHNTIKYSEKVKEIAEANNLMFIDGIEITTIYRKPTKEISVHILGYGKKLNRKILEQNLVETINGYNDRAKKIIKKLNTLFPNLKLNYTSIKKNNYEAYTSRETISKILTENIKKNF